MTLQKKYPLTEYQKFVLSVVLDLTKNGTISVPLVEIEKEVERREKIKESGFSQ